MRIPSLPEAPKPELSRYREAVRRVDCVKYNGVVEKVIGLVIESQGPAVEVGEVCHIRYRRNAPPITAEVVGFRDRRVLLMPIGPMVGIRPGSEVIATGRRLSVPVGPKLLGRVVNGLGEPIDGKGPLNAEEHYPVRRSPPEPMSRARIARPLQLGIRSIDALLTCGYGQRMGIFSGSGVGKSTLMGMIARNTSADVNVVALTGERGREVRDFIENDLGPDGLARSVVVVSTSDQPALLRLLAAEAATAIAEYFRDEGKHVILMMDSVTRVATAQREIGLAIGEPPATRGYTPSVFALLPKLLERAGTSRKGSITGLYTVLVEADDMNDPVGDQARSILDGHIVLSRELAAQNQYPPVDVLSSVSRLMRTVTSGEHFAAAQRLRQTLATYQDQADLINIGAYSAGTSDEIDYAIKMMPTIKRFLSQDAMEKASFAESVDRLIALFPERDAALL
jgi:flagellum-specific ATP synthase